MGFWGFGVLGFWANLATCDETAEQSSGVVGGDARLYDPSIRLRDPYEWRSIAVKYGGDIYDETPLDAADEIERLRAALRSIAANACCDSCREAALVARKALEGKE